jgi:hypothetical protein
MGPGMPPLKRIGIVVFETIIQESRSGLASATGKIYPTAAGKQLLTEEMLTIWNEALPILYPEGDYVSVQKVKEAKALHEGGAEVTDLVKSPRTTLADGDLLYLEKGKSTAMETTINARGMQDFSFVLVPAADLLNGPKWSEHQKIILDQLARELKLDALLVVKSVVSWESSYNDSLTGDHHPESMKINIKTSTLIPLSRYHERLKRLGLRDEPNVTLAYRTHEGTLEVPVKLDVPVEEQDFEHIQKNLLEPFFRSYRDLSVMMLIRMSDEWRKTL